MLTIAVAASFTADPIREALDLWIHELALDAAVSIAPGGQVIQALLDPASPLGVSREGLGVVLVRFDDWDTGTGTEAPGAGDLIEAMRAASARTAAPLLLCFCPPSLAARASGRAEVFERGEAIVAAALAAEGAIEVVGSRALAALYPVADPHDPAGDALGRIPYTPAQYAALGTLAARRLHALTSAPCKVVAIDCDETLWAGVAGEDGPLGVRVDGPRRALQELLIARRDAGALLCLCSKNEEADVAEALAAHPDMVIRARHVAARRIGWTPKPDALRSLADELGVGLDGFVFLDDNPVERAAVRASCPEVVVPELPADPGEIPGFLGGLWAFDPRRVTAEDRARSAGVRDERLRDEARRAAPTLDDFLASLALEVDFTPLSAAPAARAAQLTQRTNQLNVTTRRRTEAEILALGRSGDVEGLAVAARDRFGDYGIVGLMLFATAPDALVIDTFLLSCRALGRGVEERMLARLGSIALARGRARVDVPFAPTEKNRPALDLMRAVSAAIGAPEGDGSLFRFPAAPLTALRRAATMTAPAQIESRKAAPPAAPGHAARARQIERIATDRADVGAIVAAIHAHRKARSARPSGSIEPLEGAVEEALAAIWCEALHLPEVGARDGFFGLGGDSVAMVQVISRIRDALGAEVPPDRFFGAPTIRGLAEVIRGLGEAAPDPEDDALLALIEGLSAVEVSALLEPVRAEAPQRAVQGIASIGFLTADRPAALARAVESYHGNARRHDRAPDLVVLDDSRGAGARAANVGALRAIAGARGASIRYAGAEEKAAFIGELTARGVPKGVARFALLPDGGGATTVGANRNALLLDAAGDMMFSADDDTICDVGAAPDLEDGAVEVLGRDPCDYWFFADHEAAVRAAARVDRDPLAAHEAILGADARDLVTRDEGARAARPVVITLSGLAGDCGWGAPFGWWQGPMGYLAMRGASLARLFAASEGAPASRAILRVARRPILAGESLSMTTFVGLDARDLLPPFCPIGRGEDNLFGAAIAACIPGARFGHVPLSLVHAPAPERRFMPGEMARTAGGVDASRVLLSLVRAWEPPPDTTREARVRGLGAHLVEVASEGHAELDRLVRARLVESNGALTAWLEDGLATPGAPAWWRDETRRYLDALRRAPAREDYAVPLDLRGGGDLEVARGRLRDLVRRTGELFVHWPAMVEAARDLRARGVRLGAPVNGAAR